MVAKVSPIESHVFEIEAEPGFLVEVAPHQVRKGFNRT